MRLVCTLGPTLTNEEAVAILPGVEIKSPVAHGDVLRWDLASGDVLAIIDGLFFQAAAIRHKEIIELLSRNVRVLGASSMGALRAVELDKYGMEGVGRVYRLFRAGVLDGDDEVAVLHTSAEDGYRQSTEALVNVRYTCRAAVQRGVLRREEAESLIASAKDLPFSRRTWSEMLRAVPDGMSELRRRTLEEDLAANSIDVKREDAIRLLSQLGVFRSRPPSSSAANHSDERSPETVYIHGWKLAYSPRRSRDPAHERRSDYSDQDVLTLAQVFAVDYPKFQLRVNLERFAYLAQRGGRRLPTTARLRRAAAKCTPAQAAEIAINRDAMNQFLIQRLSVLSLLGLADSYAWRSLPIRALERAAAEAFLASGIVRLSTLDELPWRRWLRAAEIASLNRRQQIARLASRAMLLPPGVLDRATLIQHLRLSRGYIRACQGIDDVRDFNASLKRRNEDYRRIRISQPQVATWFLRRWGETSDPQIAMFERGFLSRRDFLDRAAGFYPFDKLVGTLRAFRVGAGP
jgi:hypothetical protein